MARNDYPKVVCAIGPSNSALGPGFANSFRHLAVGKRLAIGDSQQFFPDPSFERRAGHVDRRRELRQLARKITVQLISQLIEVPVCSPTNRLAISFFDPLENSVDTAAVVPFEETEAVSSRARNHIPQGTRKVAKNDFIGWHRMLPAVCRIV